MRDAEFTQTEKEVTVAPADFGNVMRSDGSIKDRELLELLDDIPPLRPVDLLKLAIFFEAYPASTNAFLGERLLLTALTAIVTNPRLREGVEAVTGQADDESFWDLLDDANPLDPVQNDEGAVDAREGFDAAIPHPVQNDEGAVDKAQGRSDPYDGFAFYKLLPVSGIGVLVEGRPSKRGKILYFFASVVPPLATLSETKE